MIAPLATLLAFQLAGEALAFGFRLPIPGPVIGMALLLGALAARPALFEALRPTATTLLQHLSLLFVPAGVGVMVHGRRLADEGAAIVVALVISTVLALAATALTVRALWPRDEEDAA
ncbi:CidA/LrgA family protein [Betaproteobacteria bacterium PRO7]|nr:CidA/LrgA family protein [Betaproteobacteria bacterium PRO7]GIL06574.1 MAG: CidA/LrgA family protein [Betaproteobacteria bacterium]